ncbi:MAG: hypothetical protein LBD41_02540 [Clostridiales Family XIII bacterium]|nr:hypothetical protein [Clostridiales Family XIII bacterium]
MITHENRIFGKLKKEIEEAFNSGKFVLDFKILLSEYLRNKFKKEGFYTKPLIENNKLIGYRIFKRGGSIIFNNYINIAKRNNLYFESPHFSMNPFEYFTEGCEGRIYKYNNIIRKVYTKQVKDLPRNIKLHNKYFSNKRKIVGALNKFYFIEESVFIEGKKITSMKEFIEYNYIPKKIVFMI